MEVASLFSFCFTITFQVTSQNLLTQNEIGLPNLTDYKNASNDHRITVHNQAIIPTYKLNGCGKITKWGLDVFDNKTSFILDLQVWRPSSTVQSTGCYSLVGNNRFTSVSAPSGITVVTPSPRDYIGFQSGDVLGFYVEDVISSAYSPGVVVLISPSQFTSESVWFASIAGTAKNSQNGDCPYSVGSNGVLNTLTQAAPVISISITNIPCSPTPSSDMKTTIFTSVHTFSTNTAPSSNLSSSITVPKITLSSSSKNITVSSKNDVSLTVPRVSKYFIPPDVNNTIAKSRMRGNNITLIVSAVIPTSLLSLIIIVTFVIIILLRSGRNSRKRKQSEPEECVSQQGISNRAYFEPESQLQTREGGIEIVPTDNGQSVIYHCIGPSTSKGNTVSSTSEQPETHYYFELEALNPSHPTHQYADINQLSSSGRAKDKATINSGRSGKSVAVYEDISRSQKFQDPSKGYESESKDRNTETGVHTASINSQ